MDNQQIRLLCAGDLHLGRYPARIPTEYAVSDYSPISIWKQIVEKAVELAVDGILISGDIIDRKNRFYEAFGPFEAGIKRLEEDQIPVFTIAGNHDYDVLPRISHNLNSPFFHLLGAGGKWESYTLIKENKFLNILGWSYPRRQIRNNPLGNMILPENNYPTIGLLHTETDNPGSNYAPVSTAELENTGITGWILGHIHKPVVNTRPFLMLNPGSPQPLDPTETGNHGIWLLSLNSTNKFNLEFIPLATLKYISLETDVTNLEHKDELTALITNQLREKLSSTDESNLKQKLILVRINLQGRSRFYRDFNQIKERLIQELNLEIAGRQIKIEQINNLTKPVYDVEKFVAGNSLASLLADYYLKLNSNQEVELPETLLSRITDKLFEAYYANAYKPLRTENRVSPPDRDEVIYYLKNQTQLLLDTLIAQRREMDSD